MQIVTRYLQVDPFAIVCTDTPVYICSLHEESRDLKTSFHLAMVAAASRVQNTL